MKRYYQRQNVIDWTYFLKFALQQGLIKSMALTKRTIEFKYKMNGSNVCAN